MTIYIKAYLNHLPYDGYIYPKISIDLKFFLSFINIKREISLSLILNSLGYM